MNYPLQLETKTFNYCQMAQKLITGRLHAYVYVSYNLVLIVLRGHLR